MKRHSGKINLDSLERDSSDMISDDLNELRSTLHATIDLYLCNCALVVIDAPPLGFHKMWF